MSLLKDALEALDGTPSDWFDQLVDKLDELVEESNDKDLREGGKAALTTIKLNRSRLIGLGQKSFTLFMTYAAAGKNDEASKEYYRSKASPREIIDAILEDALDLEKIRKQREDLKQEALELAFILAKGARYLLPLILTLL